MSGTAKQRSLQDFRENVADSEWEREEEEEEGGGGSDRCSVQPGTFASSCRPALQANGLRPGRKEEGDQHQQQQQQQHQHGTLPWHRTRNFKVFSEMFSQATEPPVEFWLLPGSTRPQMGYVLTANDNKAECPLTSEDPFCSQMCFDCANLNLSVTASLGSQSTRESEELSECTSRVSLSSSPRVFSPRPSGPSGVVGSY
ncbi:unnamed protein product [Pleuronectes platessa]|uniref:Uncharacterized protein n=1 Tax=Pleuronectes platessa TaxID=8262 RepID=A0A9N7UG76_PLEPL|nr:unnamed protein product [Pleuronectes platessa]